MSPVLFVMCGDICPIDSTKRCEKAQGHEKKHRAGGTKWTKFAASRGYQPTFEALDEMTNWDDLQAMGNRLLDGVRTNFTRQDAEEELTDWWRRTAESEIGQTVAKAIEYGSTDLIDIGRDLARVAGREVDDEEAAEWGIFFYLLGKMSRWRSAMERGDRPSDDTLLDIGVYVRMAQRVRAAGGWPGTKETE